MTETAVLEPQVPYSEKQILALGGSKAFLNIAEGSVRSGKTHVWLHRMISHSFIEARGLMVIVGRTKDTVERNVIQPLEELCYQNEIPFKYVKGHYCMIAHRRWEIIGANDEQAESKVRGLTAAGAYINEATLIPKSVFNQVLARCSVDGAKVFADTNPDSPFHWLKKDYIDNKRAIAEGRMTVHKFRLTDNPSLGTEYKESLKALYASSPLFYARNIEGKWVAAEGAIYDRFNPIDVEYGGHITPFLPLTFDKVVVGVDYGTATVTTFVALGRNGGRWYLFREYYYDARVQMRQKSNDEFADDFVDFLDGVGYPDTVGPINPHTIEIDPSASGLRVDLRNRGIGQIRNADNDVIEGIRNVQDAIFANHLWFYTECINSQEEHSGYVWDSDKQDIGIDEPVKENDHTCDAVRYALKRHYGRPELQVLHNRA